MSEDGVTGDPTASGDVGERRRAIRAERERREEPRRSEERSSPPTSLVRPYARLLAPTGSLPASPSPSQGAPTAASPAPDTSEAVQAGPSSSSSPTGSGSAAEQPEPPTEPETFAGSEPFVESQPEVEPEPAVDAEPPPTEAPVPASPVPVERLRAASAALWPPATEDEPTVPEREPSTPEPEPSAADPEPSAPEPATTTASWAPETAPPGWSAFTPVVPPEPPLDEAYVAGEPIVDDSRDDPVIGQPEGGVRAASLPAGDGWDDLSVRAGDDDAWLRGLREDVPVGTDATADDPDAGAAEGEPAAVYPPFRRPPTERLTQALTGEAPAAPSPSTPPGTPGTPGPPASVEQPDAEGDEEPLRGTLEPVLRHSTERATYPAKTAPVIRPPVLPPDLEAPVPPMPGRPMTWDEALAADVVPGKLRRHGRRPGRARHESGGTEEYSPRASVDRSLTVLVIGMLLVLVVLLGVAAWALWPRVTGVRSLPQSSAAGQWPARLL